VFTNSTLRSLLVDWRLRGQDTLARFRADLGVMLAMPILCSWSSGSIW
jgi:hypothetical protein